MSKKNFSIYTFNSQEDIDLQILTFEHGIVWKVLYSQNFINLYYFTINLTFTYQQFSNLYRYMLHQKNHAWKGFETGKLNINSQLPKHQVYTNYNIGRTVIIDYQASTNTYKIYLNWSYLSKDNQAVFSFKFSRETCKQFLQDYFPLINKKTR